MFSWVSRSDLPDEGTIEWLFDVYRWLLEETGGYAAFRSRARLVLATDEFFPISRDLEGDALAQALFAAARSHAGMAARSCQLIGHEEDATAKDLLGARAIGEFSSSGPAGIFHGADAGRGIISYAPSGLRDPESFLATLAHELGHFLMHDFTREVPGSEEAREPATDVCAIFFGFGVFSANAAFRFEQHQDAFTQGWSYRRLGYLGERELSYALAIFLALLGLDARAAAPHLRPNPRAYVKNALKHLAKERAGDIAAFRS